VQRFAQLTTERFGPKKLRAHAESQALGGRMAGRVAKNVGQSKIISGRVKKSESSQSLRMAWLGAILRREERNNNDN
jgi:hypothetical protein